MVITRSLAALVLLVAALVICLPQQVAASDNPFARSASDSIGPFLIAGEAALLSMGKTQGIQGAKAVIATGVATQFLKVTVREHRPNSDSVASFPSGHTSAAFAMATSLADYNSKLKIPAYAVATTIAWSRVEVHAHRWHDVVAGAALGYYTAKHYTKIRFIVSDEGVNYTWKW